MPLAPKSIASTVSGRDTRYAPGQSIRLPLRYFCDSRNSFFTKLSHVREHTGTGERGGTAAASGIEMERWKREPATALSSGDGMAIMSCKAICAPVRSINHGPQ